VSKCKGFIYCGW